MKHYHYKRLLKLAKFLCETQPTLKMCQVVSHVDNKGCGAVCCAIGWTPKVFPKLVEWIGAGVKLKNEVVPRPYDSVASALFNLNFTQTISLFGDSYEVRNLFRSDIGWSRTAQPSDDTDPVAIADDIDAFISWHRAQHGLKPITTHA